MEFNILYNDQNINDMMIILTMTKMIIAAPLKNATVLKEESKAKNHVCLSRVHET